MPRSLELGLLLLKILNDSLDVGTDHNLLKLEFPKRPMLTFWVKYLLLEGALCIIGCLAAPLAFTR